MKKRKRKRIKKILLSILLVVLALAILAAIGYIAFSLIKKNREQLGNAGASGSERSISDTVVSDSTGSADLDSAGADSIQESDGRVDGEENAGTISENRDPDGVSASAQAEDGSDNAGIPENTTEDDVSAPADPTAPVQAGDQTFQAGFTAQADDQTIAVGDTDVLSKHALLIDLSNDRIVAGKDADVRIYPASMTKILTILVAAEHMGSPEESYTIPSESVDYCLANGCSAAGFVTGEVLPVKDLFYGTILPSGGEAAVALAMYTAGSHEAFVELMNQKVQELGLSDTAHFTNCVGVYDDAHSCTLQDMAMILKAAVENDFCREVLQTHVYYTTHTEQNPEGIILSNWFLRRIEDKDCGGTVVCAKTGFVTQSGDCAASYFVSSSGRPYICVTADTYNSWRCIYDHVAMYKLYTQ